MDGMKTLHIGIAPAGFVKRRMMAIASGEKPSPGEPRIWVSSLESLAKVLSERNMLLLQTIRNSRPQSLTELARLSGRAVSNLSRSLHGLERLGLVAFEEKSRGRKVPTAVYTRVKLECTFAPVTSKAG